MSLRANALISFLASALCPASSKNHIVEGEKTPCFASERKFFLFAMPDPSFPHQILLSSCNTSKESRDIAQ
jgi:hypothetical protein